MAALSTCSIIPCLMDDMNAPSLAIIEGTKPKPMHGHEHNVLRSVVSTIVSGGLCGSVVIGNNTISSSGKNSDNSSSSSDTKSVYINDANNDSVFAASGSYALDTLQYAVKCLFNALNQGQLEDCSMLESVPGLLDRMVNLIRGTCHWLQQHLSFTKLKLVNNTRDGRDNTGKPTDGYAWSQSEQVMEVLTATSKVRYTKMCL